MVGCSENNINFPDQLYTTDKLLVHFCTWLAGGYTTVHFHIIILFLSQWIEIN